MIEIIKEEPLYGGQENKEKMEETFTKGIRLTLPKNIRQIGEGLPDKKIYIEDYVVTYLKQMSTYNIMTSKMLLLLGECKYDAQTTYWFINGAVLIDSIDDFAKEIIFHEDTWNQIEKTQRKFFLKEKILGWAFIKSEYQHISNDVLLSTHEKYFGLERKLFFEYSKSDAIEGFYIYENNTLKAQPGYYIYYDKNENMQSYMLSLKEKVKEEEEKEKEIEKDIETEAEPADEKRILAKPYRIHAQEKKKEVHEKRVINMLYTTSTFLMLIIFVIGVTMLNNYDKMQDMEQVLNSISTELDDGENEPVPKVQDAVSAANNEVNIIEESTATKPAVDDTKLQEAIQGILGENQEAALPENEIVTEENNVLLEGELISSQNNAPVEAEVAVPEESTATPQSETSNENSAENETGAESENGAEGQNGAESENAVEMENAQAEEDVNKPENTEEISKAANISVIPEVYTVQRGDTLISISYRFYQTKDKVEEICNLNGIDNMDDIHYGEKILLP